MLGVLAHQSSRNYPLGPGTPRARGGLKCDALFDGVGKSLAVDDARFVYHDVDSGRYFGTYHRRNESFAFRGH